jgi:N-acetylneuraminic acid mutarotase
MWSRKSNDNGVTWLPDDMFSDVVTPLPAQPDGGIVGCYAGDYDYGSAILTKHLTSWVDGRVAISGQSQQDAFTDREAIGCTPGWSAGGNLPSAGVRLAGVYFPANGKFYGMGGRASDSAGSEFTHPFEYDPGTNSWTTKSATYPDTHVNNMACGVLTDAGTPYIYCVGGSQVTVVGTFDRVFRYNPVTDVISPVAAPWPGGLGMVLPGGFTVLSNKLYILGGFDTVTNGGQGTNQIWEFTPSPAAWVQKPNVLPVPLGYIPTTTIGALIYTGGGSDITAGALTDTTNSFVYNPVANTIGTIASIPRATGETRALNFNGLMLVMGGGRTAPNPSNEVDIYNPGNNTWTTGTPVPAFTTARRTFPTDTNGTTNIWLAGGYASDNVTPLSSTEVFCAGAAPMASDAFSRKVHGGAGTFDIPLPLSGNVGVECRSGGGIYQMIIDFPTSVTVGSASVTSGTGMVSSFSGSGTSQITVNLSGVTDQQRITMTLHNVNDGTHTGDVPISMGVLIADVNGNAVVNASDVSLTKSQVGNAVSGSNFREDVNANGTISATDVALVKSDVGHALP